MGYARNDGRDDAVSEQVETRQLVLARSEEPRQDLKVLVEKRKARFGEPRNLAFAAHHLEDPLDIKHQPDRVDSSDLIGIAPYRQASGNQACVAVSPMPAQVRSIGTAVQGRSSLAQAACLVHDDRKHWVTVAQLVPGAAWQSILLDAMHLDSA
jgi:hypothetical protein